MYVPQKFRVDDPEAILSFIAAHPFGLLLTVSGGTIHDTHTPFIVSEDGKFLLGHIARANPQWNDWSGETQAKVVFTGPHAYVSPSYYKSEFNVPTWNYTAVSVSGKLSVIEDESQVPHFLDQLVTANETGDTPWKMNHEDERYLKLLAGIVVFSISMDDVDASFKLNQNKTPEDQCGVIASLKGTGCPFDAEVADLMEGSES